MGELINLVKQFQKSHDLKVADEIVVIISPKLELHSSLHAPKEGVEDILQDSLVGIMLGIDRFEGDTDAEFYAWCYRITRNKIADVFRDRDRNQEKQFAVDEYLRTIKEAQPPLTPVEHQQLREALDLVAAVRPPCRDYLVAHYLEGKTFAEMRDEFGFSSEDVAGVTTRRCLMLARELLE